ncbi:MAG: PmoA family protein [Acidobacteria bacterium]|nr:PmoA family protein [Acidobacteriota bacterium]
MQRSATLILIFAAFTAAALGQTVRLIDRSRENRIDVTVDGQLFTSYHWGGDFYRPALYPIMSSGGHFVTRGFPFETRDGDTVDHPHQVGCWLAHANVDGIDFWNSSKFRSAKEMEKMGRVVHRRIVSMRASGQKAEIVTDADWVKPNGQVGLTERTRYRFTARRTERLIDRDTTLTAPNADVSFGDNKDGFFGLHLASELEQDDQAGVKITNTAGVVSTGRNAAILSGKFWNSEGLHTEKEIWGKRGRWAAVAGRIGNEQVTVAIFDHPRNPLSPTRMMVRGYGLFALNPFGQKQFDPKLDEQKFPLARGHSVRFRYRVLIAPSNNASIENEYKAFARSK